MNLFGDCIILGYFSVINLALNPKSTGANGREDIGSCLKKGMDTKWIFLVVVKYFLLWFWLLDDKLEFWIFEGGSHLGVFGFLEEDHTWVFDVGCSMGFLPTATSWPMIYY